jgi:hypothetical protein
LVPGTAGAGSGAALSNWDKFLDRAREHYLLPPAGGVVGDWEKLLKVAQDRGLLPSQQNKKDAPSGAKDNPIYLASAPSSGGKGSGSTGFDSSTGTGKLGSQRSGEGGGVPFDFRELANNALSDAGFGNVLGGKSPLDWAVVKGAEGFLKALGGMLNSGGGGMAGGGGFDFGNMTAMVPSAVRLAAQAAGIPFGPSAVATSMAPSDQGARGGGNTHVSYDNSINITNPQLSDPNQLVGPMQEQMNARTYQRAAPAFTGGGLPYTTGPGGG